MAEGRAAAQQAAFSVSHLRNAASESEGLRAFFEYRGLGIKAATEAVAAPEAITTEAAGR